MAISDSDPRVFFAAERTLLAWQRTGLTIIAIGFVVARFGLFVRLLSPHQLGTSSSLSAGLGIAFVVVVVVVVVGSLAIFAAAVQHSRFIATLAPADLPPRYSRKVAVVLTLVVATLGIGLSGYLLLTSN